jgi:hypothetical protein
MEKYFCALGTSYKSPKCPDLIVASKASEVRKKYKQMKKIKKRNILCRPIEYKVSKYKGFKLFEIHWAHELSKKEKTLRIEVAKLYIDLATSIDPTLVSGEFSVDYGVSNLSYLQREIEETGSLFRVFLPFRANNTNVEGSHEIALLRGFLEYEGESEIDSLSDQQICLLNKLLSYDEIVKHF